MSTRLSVPLRGDHANGRLSKEGKRVVNVLMGV